jgi:peptidoglycan/LPS O-acetylase OafA/YrhL
VTSAETRYPTVDAIKVAGIVTIVLIHALRPPWDPGLSDVERWLGYVTRFGVPGFLLASGFLYAKAPADAATTARRLRRILIPYLIASLLAQLWRWWDGTPPESATLLAVDLLLASSFGPYYYVLVIAVLVALTPLIARLPLPLLYAATGGFVASQWFVEAASPWVLDFFWHVRSPLLWWGYFLLGWSLRLNEEALRAFVAPRRRALLALAAIAAAGLTLTSSLGGAQPPVWVRTAIWLDVYAILALVALAASGLCATPGWMRTLSDATYTIYLYHLFFVLAVQKWVPAPAGEADLVAIGLPWLAGLAGGVALVAAGRALLGARSRDWLGA